MPEVNLANNLFTFTIKQYYYYVYIKLSKASQHFCEMRDRVKNRPI